MKKALSACLAVALLACVGCANMDIGFRKAAAVSKLSVEEAYDVVYTAYLRGLVTKDVKDDAAHLRDRYTVIQSALVRAISDSELDEATRLLSIAGVLATEIMNIVIDHKLEERMAANDRG